MVHKDLVVYHVNRDSTAIEGREKVVKKSEGKAPKQGKKRRRPVKDSPKEPTVIEKQAVRDAKISLEGIAKECAWGRKKNSEGNVSFWKGYKPRHDVSDTGFPLTAVVTGANVHDSQPAIPMEQLTEMKVPFCYSLMDSAYDSKVIDEFIRSRGRIPIIELNKRKDHDRPPPGPAEQERYNTDNGRTGKLAFERQSYPPFNIGERLQENILRFNDCGNMPGRLEVSPVIHLGVLEQVQLWKNYG
jgi:hypothetical protein